MSKGAGGMSKRFCARVRFLFAFSFAVFISSLSADDAFNKLISDKKFDEALKYADEKMPAASRDAVAWSQIARANEALGLPEKALACYMVAWRMNPKNYDALLGAAKIYNKLDQPDNALNYASKALELSFTPEASWEYARACIKLNRAAEAKKALEKVIETTPDNAIANRELGVIYFNEKQFDKAVPLLKKSYAAQADANVVFMLGKACLETNNIDSAIVFLKETETKNPSLYEAGLLLARAYFKREKFLAAATEYEKIAPKADLTALDHFNRAVAHEKAGNNDAALKAYQAAVEKFGNSKEPNAMTCRIKSGTGLLEKKNYDAALSHFQFIVEVDPEAKSVVNIYFLLAEAYMGSGNQLKAIASLEKALSLDNKNIEAYARLADLYEKNNMADKARQIYEKMMSLSPNDPHVYQVLGDYNLKAKKYGEALKHFEKCYVLDHTSKAAEGIALAASALNQWDKARDAAESAVKTDPNLLNSRIVLAKAWMREKNFKNAREHLEIIVAKRPSELEFLKQLAICYVNLNEQLRLVEVDKKIADADRANVDSRMRLAQYALSQKDVKQAFQLFKELAQLSPQNPLIFKNLYDITLQSGDKNNAAMYAKKYLSLNPNDAASQKNLGDLLFELKDQDGALTAYRVALKLDPTIKGFYKRYAELVIAKGQQDEVVKVLSNAITSGEADVSSYTTLGMIFQKKGQYVKALEMNQKAIQLDPQNFDVLASLAECQAKTGDINGAIISYEQVIMMNPKIDNEYKELGNLYSSQNRTDQAIGVYRKYLEKVPSDQEVAKKVGMFLYGKKQYQDAIVYMEMVKGYGDSNFQLALGECYFNLNNFKKAQQVYEGIRARNKGNASFNIKPVLKLLAEAYEKDNNIALAVEVYTAYALVPGQKDPDASYKAASMQEKVNPIRAKKIYEDNIQAFPNDYRNYLRLGIILAKDKATLARSASLLQKASSSADTIPTMWLELAQVYNKLGNEQEELNAYKKLVSMEPQNLEANKRLGIILMKKNITTDAMVYLEMANTLSPKDPDILAMLATGYLKTNRLKDAIDVLQKAKALKSDNPELRMQLVDLYKKTGQDKKALDEMKQLVEMKRDNKILIMYAQGLVTDGKYKEAEDVIENIKATDPENIDALMILGDVQGKQKKLDAAVETYKEISYINPNFSPALYQRAEIHMTQNKYQWAKAFYERALRADPKFALAEWGLAKVAKSQKSQSVYLEHLEKAIKLDPTNEEIKEEYQKAKK
jgi:tetratricopeptide (TPR) repeat protein